MLVQGSPPDAYYLPFLPVGQQLNNAMCQIEPRAGRVKETQSAHTAKTSAILR